MKLTRNDQGFVYIWHDRKKDMFYIGSHMGSIDDGYICSSAWMNRAYKKRPNDFKRRVLFYSANIAHADLLSEEQHWLNLIKIQELKVRYYNMQRFAGCAWAYVTTTSHERFCIAQRERSKRENRSEKQKGVNNPKFKGCFITPWGKFLTGLEAIASAPFNVHRDGLYRWCHTNFVFKGSPRQKYIPREWIGKSSRELGFSFEKAR